MRTIPRGSARPFKWPNSIHRPFGSSRRLTLVLHLSISAMRVIAIENCDSRSFAALESRTGTLLVAADVGHGTALGAAVSEHAASNPAQMAPHEAKHVMRKYAIMHHTRPPVVEIEARQ